MGSVSALSEIMAIGKYWCFSNSSSLYHWSCWETIDLRRQVVDVRRIFEFFLGRLSYCYDLRLSCFVCLVSLLAGCIESTTFGNGWWTKLWLERVIGFGVVLSYVFSVLSLGQATHCGASWCRMGLQGQSYWETFIQVSHLTVLFHS